MTEIRHEFGNIAIKKAYALIGINIQNAIDKFLINLLQKMKIHMQ